MHLFNNIFPYIIRGIIIHKIEIQEHKKDTPLYMPIVEFKDCFGIGGHPIPYSPWYCRCSKERGSNHSKEIVDTEKLLN